MAGLGKSMPSQYANNNLTSTGLNAIDFGFNAAFVRVTNDGGGAAYLDFGTSGPASTADFKLSSGESLDLHSAGAGIAGLAWSATSTANLLRVGAWG